MRKELEPAVPQPYSVVMMLSGLACVSWTTRQYVRRSAGRERRRQ